MKLFGTTTQITDQEHGRMEVAGMAASHIGIEALNLVHKAGLLQEIQSAVDGGRFGGAMAIEAGKQVIGFGGGVCPGEQFQNLAPDRRQFLAPPRDQLLSLAQEGADIARPAWRVGCVV